MDVKTLEKKLERVKIAKALEIFLMVITAVGSASLANQEQDVEKL